MQNAIKAGATPEEILETIQLTTVMGIHSCNLAVPILMDEMSKLEGKRPGKAKIYFDANPVLNSGADQ